MDKFDFSEQPSTEKNFESEELSSNEKAFLKGYLQEDKIQECAECGSALNEENLIVKEIDSEKCLFCCKECVKDYEESI